MYSLPKFTPDDFDITKLLPKCSCATECATDINGDLCECVRWFVGTYAGNGEFSAGSTKKDLYKILKYLTKINAIMQQNPNVWRYMELKSTSTLDNRLDISLSDINNFNSFFIGLPRRCSILQFYCDNYPKSSGGKYKNCTLTREITINGFVYNLMSIYKQATGKEATGNYSQGGITKDTTFISFTKTILKIINDKYPNLNAGHGIHFSIMDVMRKIGKK